MHCSSSTSNIPHPAPLLRIHSSRHRYPLVPNAEHIFPFTSKPVDQSTEWTNNSVLNRSRLPVPPSRHDFKRLTSQEHMRLKENNDSGITEKEMNEEYEANDEAEGDNVEEDEDEKGQRERYPSFR